MIMKDIVSFGRHPERRAAGKHSDKSIGRPKKARRKIGLLEFLEPRLYLTAPPAAPIITGFSTDTGTSGDRITSDNTLNVAGTADPNLTVNVFFNTTLQGSTAAGSNGSWTFLAGQKPDGIYSITALAIDASGSSSSVSGAFAVRIDTTAPPAPNITGFSTDTGTIGDQITSDTTLNITGTSESNSVVTISFSGVVQTSTTTAANGTWSLNVSSKPEGPHTITASAQDVAGNVSAASAPFSVTIDTTAPTAPVISGYSIDSGVIGDRITNDNTPTIFGTAEANSSVTVFFNGVFQGSIATAADGSWAFIGAPLDGTYEVTATAQDAAGNTGALSAAYMLTIDTTPPAAPILTGFSTDSGIAGDRITNDTTLSISGTAEPGSTVTVYVNGANQGTAVAAANSAWSFALAPYSQGTYTLTALARDAANNVSAISGELVITIDTVAPATPTITGFSTDTGLAGDRITSDNTLRVTGTAEGMSVVTVFFNGTNQGTTAADANGNWSFDAASKPDGIYAITATAQDVAGNVSSASGPLTVTIDTSAPTAPTITGFSTDTGAIGDLITSDSTLNVTGTAEANSTVQVMFNGIAQGTTTAGANGQWSLDAASKPDGLYNITASAQDVAGNTSPASGALAVTIDTTAPAAPTITGFSTDTKVIGDRITSDNTLTVTGTAEPGSLVSVFFNGTNQGTTTTGANSSWSFDALAKPDGVYNITATSRDAAGNISPASGALVVTIDTVAPTAPTITGFLTDTGVLGDRITSDNTLTVTGTGEANAPVTVLFNGLSQGTTTISANGTWSLDAAAKPDGVYSITATSQDAAGNASSATGALVVTIDSTSPNAPVITAFTTDTGTVGDNLTSDNTLTVTGTAEAGAAVTVFFNGSNQGTTTASPAGTWSFDAAPKPDGTYSITATAQDVAGNVSPASTSLAVTIDTLAPSAPTITGFQTDTGIVGDRITSDNTLTVTGTADPITPVTVYFNGVSQGTTTSLGNGTWSLNAAQQPDGVYTITAKSQDAAGNSSPASGTLVVTIDTTAPLAPAITGYSTDTGILGDGLTNDNTLTVTGTAEAGAVVTVNFNGVSQGSTPAAANGTWSLQVSQKPDGVYTITASAQDVAGNSSSASNSLLVTIDTVAPAAPTITNFSPDSGAIGDGVTNDNTPTITGTGPVGNSITVSCNGTARGTTTVAADGSWSLDTAPLPDGLCTVTATAFDPAGNPSVPSNSIAITIDTTAPAAPTIVSFWTDSAIVGDNVTNDNTLIVNGIAEPNSTVVVFFNGAEQGTTTAGANGAWTLAAPEQSDGKYSITATAQDASGNTSPASNPLSVTIDTVAPLIPFSTVLSGQTQQGSSEPDATITIYINGQARTSTTASADGGWSIDAPQLLTAADTLTFDATDRAGNRSPQSAPQLIRRTSCGLTPIVDTDFNALSGKGTDNSLVLVRERAYEQSPDLTQYGASGRHSYVQSLMFHTRDDEQDTEATAATITFSPGVTILTTITSAKLLGGPKHDFRATYSDALFGIFSTQAKRNPAWNKYSGAPRGLEPQSNRFDVTNDGRNGQPAVIELEFPTRIGPDQGRVIVDYGDCWKSNASVTVAFHAPDEGPSYTPYQGLLVGTQDLGDAATIVVSVAVAAPTIEQLSEDNGSSLTDHVTSDITPLVSGRSVPGSSVKLSLDGTLIDTVLADGEGRWSYLFDSLTPGNYNLRVAAEIGGKQSAFSDPFQFTVTTMLSLV